MQTQLVLAGLLDLPHEGIETILHFIHPKELSTLFSISRRFQLICSKETLWQYYCLEVKKMNWKPGWVTWRALFHLDTSNCCPHLFCLGPEVAQILVPSLQEMFTSMDSLGCSSYGCPHTFARLWVCMNCGHAGCARRYNKHAFSHYEVTGHHLCVKLQTLESFCMICEVWLGSPSRHPIEQARIAHLCEQFKVAAPTTMERWLDPGKIHRRQKERDVRWQDSTDRSYSLMPAQWHGLWVEYVAGDAEPPTMSFDTSEFVDLDGGLNFASLQNHQKYVLVSHEQYAFLKQQYGGNGPQIIYDKVVSCWIVNPSEAILRGEIEEDD